MGRAEAYSSHVRLNRTARGWAEAKTGAAGCAPTYVSAGSEQAGVGRRTTSWLCTTSKLFQPSSIAPRLTSSHTFMVRASHKSIHHLLALQLPLASTSLLTSSHASMLRAAMTTSAPSTMRPCTTSLPAQGHACQPCMKACNCSMCMHPRRSRDTCCSTLLPCTLMHVHCTPIGTTQAASRKVTRLYKGEPQSCTKASHKAVSRRATTCCKLSPAGAPRESVGPVLQASHAVLKAVSCKCSWHGTCAAGKP